MKEPASIIYMIMVRIAHYFEKEPDMLNEADLVKYRENSQKTVDSGTSADKV